MHRDPAQDLNPLEGISRHRFAGAIARILIEYQTFDTLRTIVVEGKDNFIRKAGPILAGHAFKQEDYHNIYRHVADYVRSQERSMKIAQFSARR